MTILTNTILGTICQDCAVAIANDDQTAMSPEAIDALMASLEMICSEIGQWPIVDHDGSTDREEFRCDTCHEDVLSFAYDLTALVPMQDAEARSIARDWQSSGPVGSALAAFASGSTIAWTAVAHDARAIRAADHLPKVETERLERLACWCEEQAETAA